MYATNNNFLLSLIRIIHTTIEIMAKSETPL